jgi:hypothetical protein
MAHEEDTAGHSVKLPWYLRGPVRDQGRLDAFNTSGLTATEVLERAEAAANNAASRRSRGRGVMPHLRQSHPARDSTRGDDFLRSGSGALRLSLDSQVGFLGATAGAYTAH